MCIRDSSIAIIGRPNVGKSSLLNIMLQESRAIVTTVPGTTRDTIEESLQIEGLAYRLTDTAGIRESDDPVESEGIERSRKVWQEADLTLLLLDASNALNEEDQTLLKQCDPGKTLVVANKMDLCPKKQPPWLEHLKGFEWQPISAKMNTGSEDLKQNIHLHCGSGLEHQTEEVWLTNLRQQETGEKALAALKRAKSTVAAIESDPVAKKELNWVKNIFSSCGTCLQAKDEDAIDAATAISGSGPGYLFYFAEQMTESAKSLGFTEEEAQLLVQKTILGATLLWESQQVSPETLRKQVSSPGGTTLAALNHFQSENVGESIKEGIQHAYLRSKELTS